MVKNCSGPITTNSWPSCSPAAIRLAIVTTTPLTCGRQASVTMQIFMRRRPRALDANSGNQPRKKRGPQPGEGACLAA